MGKSVTECLLYVSHLSPIILLLSYTKCHFNPIVNEQIVTRAAEESQFQVDFNFFLFAK